jgi:hypothetical protein
LPSLKMTNSGVYNRLQINICRVRLRATTPPFHRGDTGSNPVRGTKSLPASGRVFYLYMNIETLLLKVDV